MRPLRTLILAVALAGLVAVPLPASGHEERASSFPEPPGRVPRYRTSGPALLVCKNDATLARIRQLGGALERRNLGLFQQCQQNGYRNIQAAIDAVERPGSRILILPGVYRERPSTRALRGRCGEIGEEGILSYGQHLRCPHNQNLIAIMGDSADADRECDRPVCRLQIEGTGDGPEDVLIDNGFRKLNGIRADRADGIYFRNFTVQSAEFNAVYVLETDGFVIDRMVARYNHEYGFLTFSSDHGLYTNCEAYYNGDGGLYPGSVADLHGKRYAVEIRRCNSHHNLLGLSGTAGNSIYAHHNRFHHNTTGVVVDSYVPDHPGHPQDSSKFVANLLYSNNQDYYRYLRDGTCDRPMAQRGYERGVVCPSFNAPIGTGLLILGGNSNLVARNWFFNNWRNGGMQLWIPAVVRDETDPTKQYDTSHFNRWLQNRMGFSRTGETRPNGRDFWWDLEGEGNCWERNKPAPGRTITSEPPVLPSCDVPSVMSPVSTAPRYLTCATWSPENPDVPGCDFTEKPRRPQ